jgi:hypothetical protein
MTRIVAILMCGFLAAPLLAASPDPKDLAIPPQELSKARELIHKLGSDVYREREDAHADLVKMGRLARPALLEAAANDPDPEVRFRCSRLLPKAGSDDLKARLDTFLADTEGKYDHNLPGLKQYRKGVGTDEKARALFVEMVKSPYNVDLLQTLEGTTADAGRAISDRRMTMFSLTQQRNFGGRVQPGQQIPLADIACLLFAESIIPSKEIPRTGIWSGVSGVTFLTQQQSSTNALNNPNTPHGEGFKRIVASWLETRDDVNDLNQLAYVAGQQLKSFPQSMPLLRKIIGTEGVYGYARGQALMYLVQARPKEELPFLKTLLKDDTLVTTVWFGNNNVNPQQNQHQCLMKDVALAMLLTHTDQKMQDYGYIFPPGQIPNQQNIGYGNYAFPTEEARAAAMVKFAFWQLKQGLKDPNKKDAEPKKDATPMPMPPGPGPVPIKK